MRRPGCEPQRQHQDSADDRGRRDRFVSTVVLSVGAFGSGDDVNEIVPAKFSAGGLLSETFRERDLGDLHNVKVSREGEIQRCDSRRVAHTATAHSTIPRISRFTIAASVWARSDR